jgi:subtilisin family serine protease
MSSGPMLFDRTRLIPILKARTIRCSRALYLMVAVAFLAAMTANLGTRAQTQEPPVPEGKDPSGIAVALIDTGVNYTLPSISKRLARDPAGQIYGYDFQDKDKLPFDSEPGKPAGQKRAHGTSVANILLTEAPNARLIPYRYTAGDFMSFAKIIAKISEGPATIVSVSLGGYKQQDWEFFRQAALANPDLLFIVSAGNDGRNIDEMPVYPASFFIQNMIVVTSSDPFGRLTPESNWGMRSVHISTPGERLETIDNTGERIRVSGSSFAVPRIAALAARLKARHEDWSSAQIKKAILARARRSPKKRVKRTKYGWIANPAAD